jgi:hypothetical protein
MSDTEATKVTELRPSPPHKGEGSVTALRPVRGRDATNALRQRRHRSKRKTAPKTVTVAVASADLPQVGKSHEIKADVTVRRQRDGDIDVAAYTAAIALAGAAAFFSIKGMAVLFPGAPLSVVGMAVAMESAKLVTVGWLARRWRVTAWLWRIVLVALVAGLAVINAAGVYAQLVAAHIGERGAAVAGLESQDAALAARIEVAAHTVADFDRRLGQMR